jgi:uncharacterized protein (TIGR02001 family)
MIKSRVFLAGALLVAAAGSAQAGLTVTPAVVSDYDFRGITQTANEPALQVGATYAFDSGLYIGGWGSNVKFGPGDPKLELDWSLGYAFGDAKEGFAYDFGVVYYTYQKSGSDFNYPEIYAGVTRDWFNAKIFYSNDFGGKSTPGSTPAFYLSTTGTFPAVWDTSLVVHAGYSAGTYWDDFYDNGYFDWSVGLTKTFGSVTFGVSFIDGHDLPDPGHKQPFSTGSRVVGSISTTLPWASE